MAKRTHIIPYRAITIPLITSASPLPQGTQGAPYSFTFVAINGQPSYSWSFTGSLDSGLSLSTSGVLSGTPANVETDSITVKVTDQNGKSSSKVFSLTVASGSSPSITTTSPLPNATQSSAYSDTMAATGGTPPYTWSLTSQTGSNGWSVSSAGVVSGTPANVETDSLVIKVTDSLGATASGTFSLTVNSAGSIVFDFFIAPNGDDNNVGSLASPWSITAINSKQSTYAGKKIGIIGDIGGTQTPYTQGTVGGVSTTLYSLLNSQSFTPILNLNGGPNSSTPTLVGSCTSAGAYQLGWAIIDVSNPVGGGHTSNDNSYVIGQNRDGGGTMPANLGNFTIQGLAIRNFCFAAIGAGYTGLARQSGNIVIQDCELYGSTTASTLNNPGAIRIDNTDSLKVLNCKIHDCASVSGGFPPAYSAVFSYNSTNLTVTNCTFYNLDGSVQQKDSNQSATISYCYMDYGTFGAVTGGTYGCYYEGTTGTGQTTTIHHCIMLGPVYLQGGSPTAFSGDYEFYNNTMHVANLNSPLFYWQQPLAGGTFHAYNNVFTEQGGSWTGGSGTYGVAKATGANATTLPTWDYNYYLTAPQFCPSGTEGSVVSYASWQALGFDAHSHVGGLPYASTPSALNVTSFALNNTSPAYTGSNTGGICGANDGSGSIGCNF